MSNFEYEQDEFLATEYILPDPNYPNENDGQRGIKTMLLGGAIAAKGAGLKKRHILAGVIVAGLGAYIIKKKLIKNKKRMADGSHRDVIEEVMCDPNDVEGYEVEVDKHGNTRSIRDMDKKKQAMVALGLLAAVAVVAGGAYMMYRKKKMIKQKQMQPDGFYRDVICEVDASPNDPDAYEIDDHGQPRGLTDMNQKQKIMLGLGVAAGVAAAGVAAAVVYKRRRKRVMNPDGTMREVDTDAMDPEGYDVDCDEHGNILYNNNNNSNSNYNAINSQQQPYYSQNNVNNSNFTAPPQFQQQPMLYNNNNSFSSHHSFSSPHGSMNDIHTNPITPPTIGFIH